MNSSICQQLVVTLLYSVHEQLDNRHLLLKRDKAYFLAEAYDDESHVSLLEEFDLTLILNSRSVLAFPLVVLALHCFVDHQT